MRNPNGFYNICRCLTCDKNFYSGGIARHRKAHLERGEECRIRYSTGKTYVHHPDKQEHPHDND